MKKILLFIVACLLMTGTSIAQNVSKAAVGSYKGTLSVTIDGGTRTVEDYVVNATASATGDSIYLTFKDFKIDYLTAYSVGTMAQ